MKFEIIINYNVDSDLELNKEFEYEYYRHIVSEENSDVHCDTVQLRKNKIAIKGTRIKSIDIENCWKTPRSNYRRCILSSLFYIYNYFNKPIDITSIKMSIDNENEMAIPFVQEFNSSLPKCFSIDLSKIEYLFKDQSFPELSKLLFRLLHSQVMFVNNQEFYTAYRSFNSMYTFIYTNHNKFLNKEADSKSDKQAITSVLKLESLEKSVQKSIDLATIYFDNKSDDLYKLLFLWMMNEKVGKSSFSGATWYNEFLYDNKNILDILKRIIEKLYNVNDEYTAILPKFNGKFKKKSDANKMNYLQIISAYANYRRNKLLHGEDVDPTFLIPDVNADILSEIATIIFQLSIDLVNYINADDFNSSQIFIIENAREIRS